MNKIIAKTVVCLLGLTMINHPTRANVLLNPGFELDSPGPTTTILGWTAYGGNAYSETGATNADSGANYFEVYQAFSGQVNYTGIYQDYISGPGATYTADGWACTQSSSQMAGQNAAWIEVSFRDANENILALYRSEIVTTNSIATGVFPPNTWVDLYVTNEYNPDTYVVTNTVSQLVAPAGTYFVRYQIVYQGDTNNSGGAMLFDDLNLSPAGGSPYGNWNIVWSDEFNGDAVNTNVWSYDVGNGEPSNPGWGNNELEYYTDSTNNSYEAGGCLHIVALDQATNGYSFTSARLTTEGLFSWLYGRIEWRAQLPAGVGVWPAIWSLGNNYAEVNWPDCGEIDFMENIGTNTDFVQGSLHSGPTNYETGIYDFIGGEATTNFHTYTLDWSSNSFLYYVDGHLYEYDTMWSTETTNVYPYPFNQPFFFVIDVAIGGYYVGSPSVSAIQAGTAFPIEMLFDYFRIYNQTPPLQISIAATNSNLLLSWPSNIVCHLQAQTNLTTASGITTNWIDVATTGNSLQISPANASAFYRLASP